MRHALLLACAAAAALAAACGGSSSETPWPVEPTDIANGPAGESSAAPNAPPAERPDGGKPDSRAE
ncbi:MAG: hypothetical protein U0359_09965 [Byssovorax sp.]